MKQLNRFHRKVKFHPSYNDSSISICTSRGKVHMIFYHIEIIFFSNIANAFQKVLFPTSSFVVKSKL